MMACRLSARACNALSSFSAMRFKNALVLEGSPSMGMVRMLAYNWAQAADEPDLTVQVEMEFMVAGPAAYFPKRVGWLSLVKRWLPFFSTVIASCSGRNGCMAWPM